MIHATLLPTTTSIPTTATPPPVDHRATKLLRAGQPSSARSGFAGPSTICAAREYLCDRLHLSSVRAESSQDEAKPANELRGAALRRGARSREEGAASLQ